MIYDALIMTAVTEELSRILTGGKIERISQPTPLEVIVRVFTPNGKYDLLINCEADVARMHLTWIKRENPPQPYAFCMVLRKYLDGARIVGFEGPGGFGERRLAVKCKAVDGAPYTLLAEIMGKHSNVILLSGADVILGAAKNISADINRYREIKPGIAYRPPPKQRGKKDPLREFLPTSDEPMTPHDAVAWIQDTFGGISPLLASEVVARSANQSAILTQETLLAALNETLGVAESGSFSPIVWSDDAGNTLGAYPIGLTAVPGRNQYPRDSISVALDNAAASMDKRDAFAEARDMLATALGRARRQREKDLQDIDRGLANAARADEYQQSGDLLQSNQQTLVRGETSVSVPDYYATASEDGASPTRTIAVDAALSWRDNAERYYKKAAKARNSRSSLEERRLIVHEELGLLDSAERDVATVKTEDDVQAIHERVADLLSRGNQRRGGAGSDATRQEAPRFEGYKIKAFRSVDGWEILVGENATSNDYLTTKVAASSDIWLHVRAATSAHGVIRAQNRPASVSAATLRHAAEIVAARSEVKHSSLIPVDYTLKKYVRKPRKSAPGAVFYQNEKTLFVSGINDRE